MVTIHNKSCKFLLTQIESQERLSRQSSFQPMYILPVSSEDKLVPGYGNEEDSFPVEYPIYFIADVPHGK